MSFCLTRQTGDILDCAGYSKKWTCGRIGTRLYRPDAFPKFGGDPAICLREAIFVKSQKCPYHVTFDLDLDCRIYILLSCQSVEVAEQLFKVSCFW